MQYTNYCILLVIGDVHVLVYLNVKCKMSNNVKWTACSVNSVHFVQRSRSDEQETLQISPMYNLHVDCRVNNVESTSCMSLSFLLHHSSTRDKQAVCTVGCNLKWWWCSVMMQCSVSCPVQWSEKCEVCGIASCIQCWHRLHFSRRASTSSSSRRNWIADGDTRVQHSLYLCKGHENYGDDDDDDDDDDNNDGDNDDDDDDYDEEGDGHDVDEIQTCSLKRFTMMWYPVQCRQFSFYLRGWTFFSKTAKASLKITEGHFPE